MYGKKGIESPNYGRKLSDEFKKQMSERMKGENNPRYGVSGILHPSFGKPLSKEQKEKISIALRGSKNGQWKGDNVSYKSLHEWVKNHTPKPSFCQICGIKPPYDLANISGKYLRDLNDWQYLCRRCHMISDNRIT